MSRSSPIIFLAGLILCLLAACGAQPRQVSGEPPLVSIDSLLREDSVLLVDLAFRNINDRSLEVAGIAIRLKVEETLLASGTRSAPVNVGSRSREVIRLTADGQEAGMALLDELASGQRSGLRWHMDLTLTDDRGRDRETESSGWLHAVPGQPDRFR